MGTRSLIAIYYDGEYKVAQYVQFDGYPEGQGVGCLNNVNSLNYEKFKNNLKKVRFVDEEKDKKWLEEYDKNAPEHPGQPDLRTPEQKRWFESYISRRVGSDIITNIFESEEDEIILYSHINFANDSLFCEWGYVIDFDKMTFEVYKGYNKTPLNKNERFYSENNDKDGYYPIKHVKSFDLDALPIEKDFLLHFENDEDE